MTSRVKLGRNDYCPCGSGRKYKKCHLLVTDRPLPINVPIGVLKQLREKKRVGDSEERRRNKKLGEVRPIVSCDTRLGKLVAVGNKIFKTARSATFHEFLLEHALYLIGEQWIISESMKEVGAPNPLCKWYADTFRTIPLSKIDEKQKKNLSFTPLLSLAYDLYVLDHHLWLQKKLLIRLRLKDQFCSARYELFVAATCIRAGFQLTYEDEDDRTQRHVEFQATHKVSGQRLSVEAKQSIAAKHNYGKLINDAIAKQGSDPLVIFVDFNKSPARARRYFAERNPRIQQLLSRIHKAPNGKDLFTLLVFTNHPHHFATEEVLDPECASLIIEAMDPLRTPTDPKIVARLRKAVMQYGNIPKAFPPNP